MHKPNLTLNLRHILHDDSRNQVRSSQTTGKRPQNSPPSSKFAPLRRSPHHRRSPSRGNISLSSSNSPQRSHTLTHSHPRVSSPMQFLGNSGVCTEAYLSGHSEQETPVTHNSRESVLTQQPGTVREQQLLRSAGSAVTASLRGLHNEHPSNIASHGSLMTASNQPSASVCTTPGGHVALSAVSLSDRNKQAREATDVSEFRQFGITHHDSVEQLQSQNDEDVRNSMRIASSRRNEEEKKEAVEDRRHFTEERMLTSPDSVDPYSKSALRVGRGHSIDISSHPLLRGQNQVLSRGQFTEGSPVSSTTTTSPPRAVLITEPAQRQGTRNNLITITTDPDQQGTLHSARSATSGTMTDRQQYHWLAYEEKFEKNFGRNPYLHSTYIDQIIQKMDQKFETLGSMTRDFEDNECDLLLFKNKLYRVISDVQNDLRESANIIHILTQDRLRLKELFCRSGTELERSREQCLDLKEMNKRLYEEKNKMEGKCESAHSQLSFYKNETNRLRVLTQESELEIARLNRIIEELRGGAVPHDYHTLKEVDELKRENKALKFELDHSHQRAYSTLGIPGAKSSSALELLGNLNTLRSRSYQPLEAQSAFTHRSAYSNYSSAMPHSMHEDYPPLIEDEVTDLRVNTAGNLVKEMLQLVKGERNSRYQSLLAHKFADLDELQRALQELAITEKEEQGADSLLGVLSLLIGLIKKTEKGNLSSPVKKGPKIQEQTVKSVATSPLKHFQELAPIMNQSPDSAKTSSLRRSESQIVRNSLQSLNPWDSPFRQIESTEKGKQIHHIKRVSYLSSEHDPQQHSKSQIQPDSQYNTVSSIDQSSKFPRSTLMQMSLSELKELVKKEVLAQISHQQSVKPSYHHLHGESGEVSFHSSLNFDSYPNKTAPVPSTLQHVSKGNDNISEGQSETAVVTFPERNGEQDTGTKSVRSVGQKSDRFFKAHPTLTSPDVFQDNQRPGSARMLYVEYEEFNPSLITATGGLDTPDYGENKAKAGIEYDSQGSLDLASSGVLGGGMAGIKSSEHFKEEVSVISEKSESMNTQGQRSHSKGTGEGPGAQEFNSLSNSNFVQAQERKESVKGEEERKSDVDDSLFTLSHSQVTPKQPPTQKHQYKQGQFFQNTELATPSQVSETVVKKIDFGGEVSVDRKHLDDSPEPIEADSGTASILLPHLAQPSLRESQAPSESSRIDECYEANMLAVRTDSSPPPQKNYPSVGNISKHEEQPSRVLRPEMLLTEEYEPSDDSLEGEDINLGTFISPDNNRNQLLTPELPSPQQTVPSSVNATAAFNIDGLSTPPGKTAGLMDKYASNQKEHYSRISDDLLKDIKKEDWPTSLLDKTSQPGDSFSDGQASFSRGSFIVAGRVFRTPEVGDMTLSSVAGVTAGKYKDDDDIIQEGAEEEEAGTPLRVKKSQEQLISEFRSTPSEACLSQQSTETRRKKRIPSTVRLVKGPREVVHEPFSMSDEWDTNKDTTVSKEVSQERKETKKSSSKGSLYHRGTKDAGSQLLSIKQKLERNQKERKGGSELNESEEEESQLLFRSNRIPSSTLVREQNERKVDSESTLKYNQDIKRGQSEASQIAQKLFMQSLKRSPERYSEDSSAADPQLQVPSPQQQPVKPQFFKFEAGGGPSQEQKPKKTTKIPKLQLNSRRKAIMEEDRSISSHSSTPLGGRLSVSRSPFSRSHNIDGHSSVQRGSTAAALETDSDFSNESGSNYNHGTKNIIRSPHHVQSSFAESRQSARGRDTARGEDGRLSHRAYQSQMQEELHSTRELIKRERSKESFHRTMHSMKSSNIQDLQREREEEAVYLQQSYQNAQPKVDNKWNRRDDPHFKLRRSVKHVIDSNRKSTPDLSTIMSRVDTGIKKVSGIPTPRDCTPPASQKSKQIFTQRKYSGPTSLSTTTAKYVEYGRFTTLPVQREIEGGGSQQLASDSLFEEDKSQSRNSKLLGSGTLKLAHFTTKKHSLPGSGLSSRNKTPSKLRTPTTIRKSFVTGNTSQNQNSTMLLEKTSKSLLKQKKANSSYTTPRGGVGSLARVSGTTKSVISAAMQVFCNNRTSGTIKSKREPLKQRKHSKI